MIDYLLLTPLFPYHLPSIFRLQGSLAVGRDIARGIRGGRAGVEGNPRRERVGGQSLKARSALSSVSRSGGCKSVRQRSAGVVQAGEVEVSRAVWLKERRSCQIRPTVDHVRQVRPPPAGTRTGNKSVGSSPERGRRGEVW